MNNAGKKTAVAADSAAHDGNACGAHRCRWQLWRRLFIGLGVALVVYVWIFRESVRQQILTEGVLANNAPSDEAVHEMIQNAHDPVAAICSAWDTGKISLRLLALQSLSGVIGHNQKLPPKIRAMLLVAALDPDMDARELALGALDERNDPALPALSVAQLRDFDPQIRLLGLMHLKKCPSSMGIPLVVPLLNDANPQILAFAVRSLEDWSGVKFGVKLADAVPLEDARTGLTVFDEASYRKTRAAADRAAT
jgi:hypothetical protein